MKFQLFIMHRGKFVPPGAAIFHLPPVCGEPYWQINIHILNFYNVYGHSIFKFLQNKESTVKKAIKEKL